MHVDQWFSTVSDVAPEDTWECLEKILVMATADLPTAIHWAEARNAAEHPNAQNSSSQQRIFQPQMSGGHRLRIPGVDLQ